MKIDLEITSEDMFQTSSLRINNVSDFSMLKTESKTNHPVYLSCQTIKRKGSTIFQLSAELFLFNQLGVQLGIAQEGTEFVKPKNEVFTPDLFSTFELKSFNYDDILRKNVVEPFVYTSSSTEEFQVRFMILHSGKESTDKLYVNKLDASSFITLPSSPQTDDVMPASVQMKHPQDHPNTAYMYIKPAFIIINKSDISLYVKLSETVCGLIGQNCYLPVRSIEPSLNAEIIMLNTQTQFNLLESSSFSMLLSGDLSLVVTTNVIDSVKYITFDTEKCRRTIAVINDTENQYTFYQNDSNEPEFKFTVFPYSAKLL